MAKFPFTLPPRYEFTGESLHGGQGFVYICNDRFLSRKVAIKVMSSVSDSEVLRQEFATMRDIQSFYIAEIYDLVFAKRSGMMGLIQEYVSGESLEAFANSDHDTLTLQRTLWQLAGGLSDIHSVEKVHRDIKPANARFDDEGVLKILDFGIASNLQTQSYTMNARGTKHFLAPEYYNDPPVELTKSCDIYAFGVTVWCIASKNRIPPQLRSFPPQCNGTAPSLKSVWDDWPPAIIDLLDQCVNKDHRLRPSILAVRDALECHLLFGKHRATFIYQGQVHELSIVGKTVKLQTGGDSVTIVYDGLGFQIRSVTGAVYVNNSPCFSGQGVLGCCVFTLGAPELRHARTFVTMDQSHPELLV